MDAQFEKMIERVEKLLAKAESTSHPAEAEAFTAKAQQIMSEYQIEEAMLTSLGQKAMGAPTSVKVFVDKPYADQKVTLLNSVAVPNRCKMVYKGWQCNHRDYKQVECTVYGFESDLQIVQMLYNSLRGQMIAAMWEAYPNRRGAAAAWKKSFFMGYAGRVGRRLQEIQDLNVKEATMDLLPVLANRQDEIQKLLPPTKSRHVSDGNNFHGMDHGDAAGRRADLGQDRVSTNLKGVLA